MYRSIPIPYLSYDLKSFCMMVCRGYDDIHTYTPKIHVRTHTHTRAHAERETYAKLTPIRWRVFECLDKMYLRWYTIRSFVRTYIRSTDFDSIPCTPEHTSVSVVACALAIFFSLVCLWGKRARMRGRARPPARARPSFHVFYVVTVELVFKCECVHVNFMYWILCRFPAPPPSCPPPPDSTRLWPFWFIS